jgi:hypothetical protein
LIIFIVVVFPHPEGPTNTTIALPDLHREVLYRGLFLARELLGQVLQPYHDL